jgi:hypothetical protein
MKKSIITHVLVMIIAVVVGSYLTSILSAKQASILQNGNMLSKAPLGGFNKFASDVQWMFFINYAGGLSSVNKENSEDVYNKLTTIIANDPNHDKAYDIGGMLLTVAAPMNAVELFTRGANNPKLNKNWKLPFQAAFVLDHYVTDEDDPQRLQKAEELLSMAIERNSSMPHVYAALIRIRAKRLEKRGKWSGMEIVNSKHAYLCALYDQWRKSSGSDAERGIGDSGDMNSGGINIKQNLMKAVKAAKKSAPNNKIILKTIEKVMTKVLDDQHLCAKCLSSYNCGDKFCGSCGYQVKVYGVCKKCNAVLKSKFCTKCGLDNTSK